MRLCYVLFRHPGRWHTKESKIKFKESFPLQLRNEVSGVSGKTSDVSCLQEMAVMFACMKKNDFKEAKCGPEVSSFLECYNNHSDEKKVAKKREESGQIIAGRNPLAAVNSPANSRLLKVAIIGLPNAGKSTLINNMMSLGVCPVSKRVHTTRTNQKAVLLENEAQVVFVDTPGLVNMSEIKKFSFPKDFVFGPEKSILLSDVIAVIHDISNAVTRNKFDPRVRAILEKFPDKNSILILNKVDMITSKNVLLETVRTLTAGVTGGRPIQLKKSPNEKRKDEKKFLEMDNLLKRAKERMEMTEGTETPSEKEERLRRLATVPFSEEELNEGMHLTGWPKFHDVFMISAQNGEGVNLLKDYFVTNAQPSSWMFNEDFLTDIQPTELTIRIIKSKLLDYLPQEIPYLLTPKIEYWDQKKNGELRIVILLQCPNERYVGRVVGTGAAVITRITSESESILTSLLRMPVSLTIKPFTGNKPK